MRRLPAGAWKPLLILAVVLSVHAATYRSRLRVNWTESLPRGLYRLTSDPLHRGALVVTCLEGEPARVALKRGYLRPGRCRSGVRPVLKIVAAIEGDAVVVSEEGVEVNGRLLSFSAPRTKDRHGRPVATAPFGRYQLAGSEVWLHNPVPFSWDSRYFGPVTLEEGEYDVARPVLTFPGRQR